MFINREKELSFLENKWNEQQAQMIVLWGKRRVGKTELVKQFIREKPHIYFLAESTGEKEQLKRFSRTVGEFFNEPLLLTRGFDSWEESFQYIKEKGKRLTLVIDEFPYLILSNRGIPSLFQKAWDEYWSKSQIYLILLGSSVGMMETEVLGYKAPLYGRRTGQWKLQPIPFSSISAFRQSRSFEDRLMHYSVAGGIPAYWLKFSEKKDFYHNLTDHVLKKGETLYDEVEFLLREELREPRYYFSLLQAMAQGKRKLSEIVNATGISQPVANKYLGTLIDLDLIEREVPVTEEKPLKSKKGLYKMKDEFFRFWFRFIFPRRAEIEMEQVERVVHGIKQDMPQYLSIVYEKVAKDVLWEHSHLFFPFDSIGKWWDRNDEIDLIGLNKEMNKALFVEVKWTEKPVGTNILQDLKAKSEKASMGKKEITKHYALFSKRGFTADVIRIAGNEGIVLFEKDKPVKRVNP